MKMKALALLCIVDFMVILDSQIVILGIPPIQEDLGFSAERPVGALCLPDQLRRAAAARRPRGRPR